jgi:hypothetical protein
MSPHFGLMDPGKMNPAEAALLRAKLHWRGGCRRLREAKTAAGIAALYDALLSGLRWHILMHRPASPETAARRELENEGFLFNWGRQAGILDQSVDLAGIRTVVDQALGGGAVDVDRDLFREQLELLLTGIGVLPFADKELPPEDPDTF